MLYPLLRKLTCPFDKLEKLIPLKSRVLDVGCGQGIFTRILAQKSKQRYVLGIDPSSSKIKEARRQTSLSDLEFLHTRLEDLPSFKFDCVVIIDVLYLLPDKEKLKLLKEAKKRLKKSGLLLLKTESTKPNWLFRILKLEETIMVKVLKFTYSDRKRLYFTDPLNYKKIIKKAGFRLIKQTIYKSFVPYLHPTYVAKKT